MADIYGSIDIGNLNGYVAVSLDGIPSVCSGKNGRTGVRTTAFLEENGNITVPCPDRSFFTHNEYVVERIKFAIRQETIEKGKDPGARRSVRSKRILYEVVNKIFQNASHTITPLAKRGETNRLLIGMTYPNEFARNIECERYIDEMQEAIENVSIAGIDTVKVIKRIPESVAAGIDFYEYIRKDAPEEIRAQYKGMTAAVFDLGHGTLDVSVMRISSDDYKDYDVFEYDGSNRLGGYAYDKLLYEAMLADLNYRPANSADEAKLKSEAVRMKEELSDNDEALLLNIPDALRDSEGFTDYTMTRRHFEEITAPLMDASIEFLENIINDAARRGISPDYIICTGGMSKMPQCKERIAKHFKNIRVEVHQPDYAVCFGAARCAARVVLELLAPNDYYAVTGTVGRWEVPIIKKNTVLPFTSEWINKRRGTLPLFDIHVFSDKKNTSFQNHSFDVPPNTAVSIRMTLDENMKTTVECKDDKGTIYGEK